MSKSQFCGQISFNKIKPLFKSGMVLFIVSLLLYSCSPKHSEIVLAEFSGNKVLMGEFEKAYGKNAGSIEKNSKDLNTSYKNFLDLYVNFKMKLRDAEVRGLSENTDLLNELVDYKKKVGATYAIEKIIIEPGIKKLYEQREYELRVGHLMIRPDSTGDEAARTKTQALLDRIKAGESFDVLCAEHSSDHFSKDKGGDIYFITAGMIIPEFEDAAYSTPVGQVYPEVVKTKFGYHIIKVTEKRKRDPQIRASHIMVDFYNEGGEVDSANSRARIDSVKQMIASGKTFEELAPTYSDDQGSKDKGGDLGFFSRRQMVQEFDEAVFNLEVGQISDIVRTNFGYHIIKLTEKKPYPTFEEDKEELKRLFKQTRYNDQYEKLVGDAKSSMNYVENSKIIEQIAARTDSVKVGKSYVESSLKTELGDSVLYTLGNQKYSLNNVMQTVEENYEFSNRLINAELLKNACKKTSDDLAMDYKAMNLDKEFPEFAELMDDYKNGIYIFKLQEEEIWNKIQIDSVELEKYWEKNKDKFRWNDRVEFAEIFSRSDSMINDYHKKLKNGEIFDTLAGKYTERPGFKEKFGKFELHDANSSELAMEANNLKNIGDFSNPFKNSGGFSIVKLIKKEAARTKTFEEAKAEVSGAFQEHESKRLEEEYLNRLQKVYKPVYYYEKLNEAFKQ